MDSTQRFVVKKPGEGRTIAVVGDVYRFLATGEDTSGSFRSSWRRTTLTRPQP